MAVWQLFLRRSRTLKNKELLKLQLNLGGVRDMTSLHRLSLLLIPSVKRTQSREANRLHIPVVSLLDTNSDPDVVDYGIPANDDAKDSVETILTAVCGAIAEGLERA